MPLALCLTPKADCQKLISYVNPFIGTGGHGHTFPGPSFPFGACQLSPDTRKDGSWDGCSGYHYSDSVIYGFSHTHLSGTGCSDYGDILLMPVVKELQLDNYQYKSTFSHNKETAKAGYYQVYLEDNKVNVELTSTLHGGIHKYTYSNNDAMYVVLDLKHRDEVLDSKMEKIDDFTIQGYRFSKAWAKNQKVFYRITFSNKIESIQYDPVKSGSLKSAVELNKSLHCIIKFQKMNSQIPKTISPNIGQQTSNIVIKVAISGVDEQGAAKNMLAEMKDWDFEKYRHNAEAAWEKELGKIKVTQFESSSSSSNQLIVFYTALYHCMIHPSIYNDVDNRYRGRDDKIHSTEGKFDYYTVFSLWDTYRALHPLLTTLKPPFKVSFKIRSCESAALDVPFLHLSDPADARPAILLHMHEVFHAIKVSRDISSLLLGSLLAGGVGLVDVVNAADLQVVGAVGSRGKECQEGEDKHKQSHY